MIFDTGAEISLINRKTFDDIARNSMQAVHLKQLNNKVREYSGRLLDIVGRTEVTVQVNDMTKLLIFFVVDNDKSPAICGTDLDTDIWKRFSIMQISMEASFTLK